MSRERRSTRSGVKERNVNMKGKSRIKLTR